MVSKTVKTLVVEICASLLIAAALAGFNLVASEAPMPEFNNDNSSNPVLLAHGRGRGPRGGGGRGARHHGGGMGHHPWPQGQRPMHGGHARPGSNVPATQDQPANPPETSQPPALTAPTTGNEPPPVR